MYLNRVLKEKIITLIIIEVLVLLWQQVHYQILIASPEIKQKLLCCFHRSLRNSAHLSWSISFEPVSHDGSFVYLHFPDVQFRRMVIILHRRKRKDRGRGMTKRKPLSRRWVVATALRAHLCCHIPLWNYTRDHYFCMLDFIKFFIYNNLIWSNFRKVVHK